MKTLSLSELQRSIQVTLVERFVLPIWVSAEVADLKVNSSGHCYMELIEKGESDGVARAQARGVIWRSAWSGISARFEAETGAKLERGIKILAKVQVNYNELYGLSLQITDIDPTYTLGESERQRQLAIKRLKDSDSYDKNRELELPQLVQRIAIVSSSKAAGYQDFMREITKSEYHFELTLFEATMQGAQAEQSIIDALIAIANRREEFDIVAVLRGGGSTNDLNCFDSYRLALHFARFPRPVISGIGHDKDVSVVDLVAQISVKTPTAVAGWFIDRMMQLDGWLLNAAQQLQRHAVDMARKEELHLEGCIKEVATRTEELLNRKKRELVEQLVALPELAAKIVTEQHKRLDNAATVIDGYSPARLLAIGFAIARSRDTGRSIDSVERLESGDVVTIQLHDGEIDTEIKTIKKYGAEEVKL